MTAPSAPGGLAATSQDEAVTLHWTAPTSNGGASIEGYNVYVGDSSGNESPFPDNGLILVPAGTTTYTVYGLSDGDTYYFDVTAVNAAGDESPAATEVSSVPVATLPATVTGVTAAAGYQTATVTWSPSVESNGSSVSDYTVTYHDLTTSASGTFCTITDGATTTGLGDCTNTLPTLTDGNSYNFTVVASTGAGSSAPSAPSNTIVPAPQVPSKVTDLRADYGSGTADLWFTTPSMNGGTLVGYNIYESTTSGGEGTTPANGSFPVTGTVYGGRTELNVLGLTDGKTYYFTVSAINSLGTAAQSTEAATTPTDTVPNPPSGVTITAGPGTAALSWTAPSNTGGWPVADYWVYRCTVTSPTECTSPNTNYSYVGDTGGATSFVDGGLTYGDTYAFVVETVGSGQPNSLADLHESYFSGPSTPVSTTPTANPSSPSLSIAETASTNPNVTLTWTTPGYSGNASSTLTYTVYENGTPIATNVTSPYTTTGLTSGTTYTFDVEAVNLAGNSSAPSNSVTFNAGNNSPEAVAGLSATPQDGSVYLSWTPPAYTGYGALTGGSSGTTVYVSEDGGAFAAIGSGGCSGLAGNASECTYDATNGHSYSFYLVVENSNASTSPHSSTVTTSPTDNDDTPDNPTGLHVTSASATTATITWTASQVDTGSPPVLGYDVFRYGHLMNTALITGTSFTLIGLNPGQYYDFEVEALNANGWSGEGTYNDFQQASVAFPAPTNLLVVTNGNVVSNSWTAPVTDGGAPIIGYYMEGVVSTTGCSSFDFPLNTDDNITLGSTSSIGDQAKGAQLVALIGCGSIVNYEVRVEAINANFDTSAWSNYVTPVSGQVGAFLPDAPTSVSANPAGGGSAFVAWGTPSGNGAPISGYTVTPYVNGVAGTPVNASASANSVTIHGLTPGSNVYFTVSATNSVGTGSAGQSNVVTIPKYVSTTSLKTSRSTVKYGHEGAVTLSVKVTGSDGAASGTVKVPGACVITLHSGKGSCTLGKDTLLPGTHHLKAHFLGSSSYNASSSSAVTLIVTKAKK